MKSSEYGSNAACARLADHLQERKDVLIKTWLARARKDSVVLSDQLTQLELLDHVPRIFDAVVEELRDQCRETKSDVKEVTARHTVIRWVQNYDLRAVLREVSLLRTEFTRQLLVFDEENADVDSEARIFNATTMHRILDDVVMDATETFLRLKDRAEAEEG